MANGVAMVTRCCASACCSEGGEPMVNSPAGISTLCGQASQSLNSVKAPGTAHTTGGAARRCSGARALSRGSPAATSAAVAALNSAICASRAGCACASVVTSPVRAAADVIAAAAIAKRHARIVIVVALRDFGLFLDIEGMAGIAGDPERAVETPDLVLPVGAAQFRRGLRGGGRAAVEVGKARPDVRRGN